MAISLIVCYYLSHGILRGSKDCFELIFRETFFIFFITLLVL